MPCPSCNEQGYVDDEECEQCGGEGCLTGDALDDFLVRQDYMERALYEAMLPDRLEDV